MLAGTTGFGVATGAGVGHVWKYLGLEIVICDVFNKVSTGAATKTGGVKLCGMIDDVFVEIGMGAAAKTAVEKLCGMMDGPPG